MTHSLFDIFQRKNFVTKLVSWTDRGVNPHYSVAHLFLIKLRIFAEWAIRRILLFPNHGRALRKLKKAKNSKSECSALVLANGPSVNKLDVHEVKRLQELKSLEVVAVNYFPIVDKSLGLVPDHLVLSDPATMPGALSESNLKLWEWIAKHQQTTIYVPTSWSRDINESASINADRVLFFDDTCLLGWSSNISPVKARGYVSLTAYKALAISLFLGFKNLSIIGFDNSQFRFIRVTEDNEVIQDPNHFTAYGPTSNLTANLFNGISDYFYDTAQVFADLRLFRKHNVANLDRESLIDCFPKIKNSNLLKANQ
jgi:hypothetical protein